MPAELQTRPIIALYTAFAEFLPPASVHAFSCTHKIIHIACAPVLRDQRVTFVESLEELPAEERYARSQHLTHVERYQLGLY